MEDFEIENGVLTEYQGKDVDVIVPEGVREIGEGAFWRCDVESVRLPQGIRAIRSEAFMNCRSLRRINLPESLRTIETEAFSGSGLRAIRLPEGLKRIEADCFSGTELTEIVIPEGVRVIRDHAFSGCRELRKVILPAGLTMLEDHVFLDCPKLREIELPPRAEVGTGVFDFCTALAGEDGFVVVNGMLFNSPAFSGVSEVTLPQRVRVIKSGSVDVSGNDGGSIVRIPAGVERIESSAFRGNIPRIVSASGAAFGCLSLRGCSHLLSLTVPAGTEVSECAFGFDEEAKNLRSRLTVHYTGGTE